MSTLEKRYTKLRNEFLSPIATELQRHLSDLLEGTERIDRISVRIKTVDRFLKKAGKTDPDTGDAKYDEPLEEIQDIIGARIVVFYKGDVDTVSEKIEQHFSRIEDREVSPESEYEFGYFGKHFVLILPSDVFASGNCDELPEVFELQVKTLFEHAWSEASHDLDYKEEHERLNRADRRQIAFASAQSWGADQSFHNIALNRIKNYAANQ